ncbi:hypothetical protein [Qipengyuania aquimaris]|uniref:hypothetical protein n=1 Tax=Qipengyuania aquimaris TaxID=255984 RepID=UPI001CD1C98D|nr:hypothetical protein [Qipengyuania aquimaris]MCA0902304.1 hypothetical protein [Qipengyuania aquimaris]
MRWIIAIAPLALAACGPTPEEKAAADARAVAEVEANQEPPPEELAPGVLTFADVENADMFGAGCNVLPNSGSAGGIAIAVAQSDAGYFKRENEIIRMAADAGSRELPYLAREKYSGLAYSMRIEIDEDAGKQSGDETIDYPSVLTIRDAQDRVVYRESGTTQCGA